MGPLTEADEISKIAFGFMGSQALFTALDQQVFTHLADGALSVGGLQDDRGAGLDDGGLCVGGSQS